MAEDEYVSKDQHRADLLALRGELKEDISGIRQDVALLAKNVEHLAQTMNTGFADMRREMSELKSDMSRQISDLKADTGRQIAEIRQTNSDLRQDMRSLNTTVQRQMWALIALAAGTIIKVMFFP